jgi:catechol 2,3-dioxygenase-like lactoylglutathione lyase family enzyme
MMQAPMRTMLQCHDLQETIDFYTQMLEFRLEGTWGPEPDGPPTWCSLDYGPGALMFTHGDGDDPDGPKVTGSLYFYPDDVDALHAALVARGAKPITRPTDREYGMRDFAIEDPNGFLLIFGQAAERNDRD